MNIYDEDVMEICIVDFLVEVVFICKEYSEEVYKVCREMFLIKN